MKSLPSLSAFAARFLFVRKLTSILPLFLVTYFAGAQDFGQLGNYSPEELSVRECSFDKEANAMMLVSEAIADYNVYGSLTTSYHIKLKILKEKGLENAQIEILFLRMNDYETIEAIEGVTINPLENGGTEIHQVEQNSIYFEKTSETWGKVKFRFPSVKVGSILEYTYRSTVKSSAGLQFHDWLFQLAIPVVKSKYQFVIKKTIGFAYQVQRSPEYPIYVWRSKGDDTVNFEMRNIPALNEEPFMDAKTDYVQKVKVQLTATSGPGFQYRYRTTWSELAKELLGASSFGGQLDKNLEGSEGFIKQVKTLSDSTMKLIAVYNYVKQKMDWTGSKSLFSSDGIKTAWKNKTGSSADLNLILANLLKAVGLNADVMLVSERGHGKVDSSFPFIDQFNTIMVLANVDNREYYLDATKEKLPYNLTPYEVLNTTAFIANKRKARLVDIKDNSFLYEEHIIISGAIEGNHQLTGNGKVISSAYARSTKLETYKSGKETFIDHQFKNLANGIHIDSFQLSNEGVDTLPLIQDFAFTLPLTVSGAYSFLNLNWCNEFASNPFTQSKRFTNINFGYRQRISISILLEIPDLYAIDVLPKPIATGTSNQNIKYQRYINFENGKLIQNEIIEVNASIIDMNQYLAVQEFYKRMIAYMNEPIVLKKK